MSEFESTPPDVTPAALPDPNTDDAWQSDGDGKAGQALPDNDQPPVAAEPAVAASGPVEPEEAPASKLADRERNPDGTLKPKGKRRDDPYVAVKEATGKAAKYREEAEQARREAAEWRAKAEAKEAAKAAETQPAQPVNDGFPSVDEVGTKYPDWDSYERAKAKWHADQDEKRWQARQDAIAEQREQERATQRIAEASQTVPNWTELVNAADQSIVAAGFRREDGQANWPKNFLTAVTGSDKCAEIVQFLGSHPEECTQWAKDCAVANPPAATVVRRLLERQVSMSAAALPDSARVGRPSTAKPPVNRVGSSATATPLDPDDLPFGPEYIKAENDRERKAREGRRAW